VGVTSRVEPVQGSSPDSWVVRAWVALGLVPVFLVLALVLGHVAYDLMGYLPENDDAPLWVDVVCTIPSVAVLLIPCAAAVVYGRRARASGDPRGVIAVVVGALVALGFTLLSFVSVVG